MYVKTNKTYLVCNFNLNILDYETNTKVKNFFNLMFQHGLVPVINKKTGIINSDISNHFPIL